VGRYRVDPRVVHEVRMKDGTAYKPNASGIVTVDARHEREMDQSGARLSWRAETQIGAVGITVHGADGLDCPTCHHANWAWQHACGRCGEVLDER
jgi:hypothetical protein